MKIIELLNKIANNEIKDKTKFIIKFKNGIQRKVYYDKKEVAFFNCLKNISDDEKVYDHVTFNDEIELLNNNKIESNNIEEIEELNIAGLNATIVGGEIANKINELIRAVNKLIKESEESKC